MECLACNAPLVGRRRNARTCNPTCRTRLHRQRRQAEVTRLAQAAQRCTCGSLVA